MLARYTFAAREVFTDVILAATSLYLIIGSLFAAIFALVEALAPGSFASASGAVLDWQQLLYFFSYVTLTSLGYGDILPTGFHAQAFAAFEAIGVVGAGYTVMQELPVLLVTFLVPAAAAWALGRRLGTSRAGRDGD